MEPGGGSQLRRHSLRQQQQRREGLTTHTEELDTSTGGSEVERDETASCSVDGLGTRWRIPTLHWLPAGLGNAIQRSRSTVEEVWEQRISRFERQGSRFTTLRENDVGRLGEFSTFLPALYPTACTKIQLTTRDRRCSSNSGVLAMVSDPQLRLS